MDIDLNADLGEGYGPWRMGEDEAMLALISSANVGCGFHAGDPLIMDRTARLALKHGVDVGAHVGFPDRQGFGRRVMQIDTAELATMVTYQLGALAGPLLRAIAAFDPDLIISSSSSRAIEGAAAECGLRVASAFLADRAYGDDGLLVPRKLPGAVIKEEAAVLARVRRLLQDGTILTHSGKSLAMPVRSILVHGDTPGAVALTQTIRREIEASGGRIVPISRQTAS